MTLESAVNKHVVCHKTLAYFIGRTYLFMVSIGIDQKRLRFRQHRDHEKAHYARDCWDCEIYLESMKSWLECVGIADRQAFDLSRHSHATAKKGQNENSQFRINVSLPEPIIMSKVHITPNKAILGKQFKADAANIISELENIPDEELEKIYNNYNEAEKLIGGKPEKGKEIDAISSLSETDKLRFNDLTKIEVAGKELSYPMVTVFKCDTKVSTRTFIPNVIEPSFGIGRIITSLLEHNYYLRDDGLRRVLRLKPFLAPYKVVLLKLYSKLIPEDRKSVV